MLKYIEKYKSESLYVPASYRNMIADCINGVNDKMLRELSDAYPNSFLFRSPEMAAEFVRMEDLTVNPLDIGISSRCYAIWKCQECGYEWRTQIGSRAKKDKNRKRVIDENGNVKASRCPACFKKDKSLLTNYPQLKDIYAEDLNDIPLKRLTYENASQYIYCKCQKHGTYRIKFRTLVNYLHNGINPCGYCANESPNKSKRNKYISFADKYPELCVFWSGKNTEKPTEYSYGSHKIILWKCPECGHEWKKEINEMGRRPSCPECLKNKSLVIGNKKIYQNVKEIYDTEMNSMPLEKLKYSEDIKLHLICPVHGKYMMSLRTLVKKIKEGTNPCKYCANPRLSSKKKETTNVRRASKVFSEAHPELVKEWSEKNKIQPDQVTEFSKAEAIWKCENCGHEWTAQISARSRGFKNCPSCYPFGKNGRRLAEARPDLRKYYSSENDVGFDDLASHDGKSRIWICDKGHKITKTVASAVQEEKFVCPKCDGRLAAEDNNIAINHPELLEEWDYERNKALGLTPSKLLEGSNGLPYWTCKKCGKSYRLRINRKILYDAEGKGACPYCAERKASENNNLAVTNPEILSEWDYDANTAEGIDPRNVLARNAIMAHWVCFDCGSRYDMTISKRIQHENDDQVSCPYCRGLLVNETNCLEANHPDLMKEWAPLENAIAEVSADKITDRYSGKAWWICPECDYKYTMSVKTKCLKEKRHQNACPRCNGRLQKRLHYL